MKKSLILLIPLCIAIIGCTDTETQKNHLNKIEQLQVLNDSLNDIIKNKSATEGQIIPFFTFQDNRAEDAMNFYVALFDNSEVVNVQRWGKQAPVEEGKIMHATFNLNGKLFMCSDSPPIHDWNFSPAVSNYLECKDANELNRLFSKLAENGEVTMPLNNYGFSEKFGWVIDQFGVSWQLNLK